ncbi:hypothetical protein HHK36_008703 [Tetracentron sinense]|uniref:Uncharacterized protein n=1 Tax=Tetracentron sinense TaxID=13715 RepID=A0A834ZK05_TETSI|nr:hypothetical protein HHK36_008703 [Tetracentron sinense]
MSRCFPYPPPGYEKNGACGEALIESIKLQRGREKAKKERKEKRREKEENHCEDGETEKKKQSHENGHKEECRKVDQKERDHQKRRRDETEHLEKSGLTEERGQPVSPWSLYDSSDSTQNSNKRKRHSSPSNGSHNQGSIIRIRLPQQKHKESEVLRCIEQPCSTSRRTGIVVQEKCEIAPRPLKQQSCSTSGRIEIVAQEIAPRPQKEQACSTSGSTEIIAQPKAETVSRSSLFGNGPLQIESQVRELIENWVPPPIQVEHTDFDDQEWLFETKQHHKQGDENFKASNDGSLYGCSTLWPHACYLPQADIYALPYTVPF